MCILTLAGGVTFDVSVIFSILSPFAPGIAKKSYYRMLATNFCRLEFMKFRFREYITNMPTFNYTS